MTKTVNMKKTKTKIIACSPCKGTGTVDVISTIDDMKWSHHCFECNGTGKVKLTIKNKQAQIDPLF